jgi:Serine acetyltransferase, N-terminal
MQASSMIGANLIDQALWSRILSEATDTVAREPFLAPIISELVATQRRLADAICMRIATLLAPSAHLREALHAALQRLLDADPALHPKVRHGVLIGVGTTILGNIEIGADACVGAGSVSAQAGRARHNGRWRPCARSPTGRISRAIPNNGSGLRRGSPLVRRRSLASPAASFGSPS